MTAKERAIRTLEQLPDDASWDDIVERIRFVAGVRRRLGELDEGQGILNERVWGEFALVDARLSGADRPSIV